jgi:hypothetical protein
MKIFTFSLVILFIFSSALVSQVHEDWVQRYNGPGNLEDHASALAIDGSGNVCVTGSSFVNGTGYDFATVVYNTSGALQWVKRYDGPANGNDGANSIAADNLGNVYVTGSSTGNGYKDIMARQMVTIMHIQ